MIIVTYLFYLLTIAAIIITFNTTMLMSDMCYTIVEREQLKNSHIPYTDNERETMWANVINETSWIDVVLIQCYMGWRPQELGLLIGRFMLTPLHTFNSVM